jgi:hypothetical protein
MRTVKIALAILTLSGATAALAEAPYPPEQPFVSTMTRAQVKQELIQAEHQGLMSQGDNYPVEPFVSTLSRAQVKQELIKAEQQGLMSQGDNYPIMPQAPSQLSRNDVEQQLQTAHNAQADTTYSGA